MSKSAAVSRLANSILFELEADVVAALGGLICKTLQHRLFTRCWFLACCCVHEPPILILNQFWKERNYLLPFAFDLPSSTFCEVFISIFDLRLKIETHGV